jgi:hypothetical protein
MVQKSKPVEFKGAPVEIGSEVFIKLCMPIVREAQTKLSATPKQLAQLYAGFLSGMLGSMAADFGQEQAASISQTVLDSFAQTDWAPGARAQ